LVIVHSGHDAIAVSNVPSGDIATGAGAPATGATATVVCPNPKRLPVAAWADAIPTPKVSTIPTPTIANTLLTFILLFLFLSCFLL